MYFENPTLTSDNKTVIAFPYEFEFEFSHQ